MSTQDTQRNLHEIMSMQLYKIRTTDGKIESQEAFCKKHNVNLRTFKQWEGQKTFPEWEKVVHLADSLNVSLDYFADRNTNGKAVLFALKEKGLSESAIQVIMDDQNRKDIIRLSRILEHPKFHKLIQAMILLIMED